LRHPEREGESSPATGTDTACTACEFIDFSGGNSNHGEKISP
jgi:hypothetical protein